MRFVVIGDIMVDKTIHGEVVKISPEAPVPVINIKYETNVLGGSGNVVKNLTSMGHEVIVSGYSGSLSKRLMSEDSLINHAFCTYIEKDNIKLRYVDIKTGYHLLRVDDEDETESYGPLTWGAWGKDLDAIKPNGIIISDYGKGAVDGNVISIVKSAKDRNIPIFVDTRRDTVDVFKGVTWMMPNLQERERIMEAHKFKYIIDIVNYLELDGLLTTKSEEGMELLMAGATTPDKGGISRIKPMTIDVTDVTGAGDTVMAAFAIAIAEGRKPREAMMFANYCAGIVCQKRGTATVSKEEAANGNYS